MLATISWMSPSHTAIVDSLYLGATFSVKSMPATLTGTLVPPNDPRFRYRGATNFSFGPTFPDTLMYAPSSRYSYGRNTPSTWAVDFIYSGQSFEIYHKHLTSGDYRIKVNGQRLSDLPLSTGAPTSGSRYNYRVDLPEPVTNALITVETYNLTFGGIVPDATGTISTGLGAYNKRVIFQGDSISNGSAMNTGNSLGTYVVRLSDYMGWDDPWNQSIGGTGYIEPGTSVAIADQARIDDVVSHSPDIIFLWAGYNDALTSLTTAANATIDAYRAAQPTTPIYLIGCYTALYPAALRNIDRDNELEAVAQAKGCYFASPITGRVRDQNGTLIKTVDPLYASPEDIAIYVGSDDIHPTDAGHNHIAQWFYEALKDFNN